jgi:16S rRNA (guanine(1405)-N(7))-methyltransferase
MHDKLVQSLKRSRKYRYCCEDTLTRLAEWATARHANPKKAEKAAKRKLHQVYAAYFEKVDLRRVERALDLLPECARPEAAQEVCLDVLRCHASTAERIPILSVAYAAIFDRTGTPQSVLDLACGFNPFALPWMGLPRDTRYVALDIDSRLAAATNRFLSIWGQAGMAFCADVLLLPPQEAVDVALLLKTLPCLEQQEPDAAIRLLQHIRARHVVVSFPTKSLSGKAKGMSRQYDALMRTLLGQLGVSATVLPHASETFYVFPGAR